MGHQLRYFAFAFEQPHLRWSFWENTRFLCLREMSDG